MVKMLIALGSLLVSFGVNAAVLSNWDQANKFKTILTSPDVINNLRGGLVKGITQKEEMVFAVEFDRNRCVYSVTLDIVPAKMPGPAQYTIKYIS